MTRELEGIFAELGLSQYLDAFVDQGFDAWETILDIQESDLDALGVKLGHRRKLQRRIANARGIAPSVSLATTAKVASEQSKQESLRHDTSRAIDGIAEPNGITKRKYRRHPKPDENAPERPPSAYVLFSNKMREDLKSQSLTFTEIAKLVGENWQSLPPAEKETYECQANAAKEKYHRDLAEYKKTSNFAKYAAYLHDFKEKQAKQTRDSSKRPKLEPPRLRHGSTSSGATPGGATSAGSRSGSSSERLQGSEPPPTRQERMHSSASMAPTQPSSTAVTPISVSHTNSMDETTSPRCAMFEGSSPRDAHQRPSRRQMSWASRQRGNSSSVHQHLPSLSDMLEDGAGKSADTTDSAAHGFSAAVSGSLRPVSDVAPVLPPARVPRLHHQPSSCSTMTSRSSTGSMGRPLGEGPLPIHALLTDRAVPSRSPVDFELQAIPSMAAVVTSPSGKRNPALGQIHGPKGYGFQSESSVFQNMKVERSGEGDVLMTTVDTVASPSSRRKEGLDGMSALLRAGEIVGRHNQG
ncbi:hypothetical protein CDD82_3547 [Ophiocordyceps australis]|uniref:HMG box domain-containing protein n=1 Tax=Ophiocordyceps australis TaxID=1399860 RepID=A0A2C5Z6A4_9HYPO|nr:hypothetical protein CDD82_3547 [Ophiocordyceps australis]